MNRTENYKNLKDIIRTPEEAKALEGMVIVPYTHVERATLLLKDFISEYFDTAEGIQDLIGDLHTKSAVIRARLESVAEDIKTAERMLDECCGYRPAES